MFDKLAERFGRTFKRMFNIDATDANSGTISHFTEENIGWDEFVESSIASSSIPAVFPSTKWKGKVFFDGGVIYSADLYSGVLKCRTLVDDDSKITVDIMQTHLPKKSKFEGVHDNAIGNLLRYQNVKKMENGLSSVLKFMVDYPDVNFRHLAVPSCKHDPGVMRLDFNDKETWGFQQLGREDAKNDLKNEGEKFKQLKGYLDLSL